MICSNCQTENATGTKFCKECGTRLGLACATCGNALLPDAKFCGECGTPVSPAATSGSGAVAASTRTAAPSAPVAERRIVSVLFADLVGFTTLAEEMTPEDVMALLRAFHGRMEEEVFRYGGCLEKFIGDALLATFGVPDTGPRDAADALACARGMLAALDAWNAERASGGLPPMRMGIGLHYGPVVAGDIGSRRSMAFATVGDTTNVASRLQALTRELGATIVASGPWSPPSSTRELTSPCFGG